MAGSSRAAAPSPRRPSSVALPLVVCVFAVGACLPTRALWVQLPGTLAAQSAGHHDHLLAVCVLSNVLALVYLVVRHCGRRRRGSAAGAEAAAIFVAMTCGLASLGLLTLGHSTSSSPAVGALARLLPTWTATTALLTAAALGAAAASLAAVTYLPFAGRLDRLRSAAVAATTGGNCVCAVLIGDALSSLIPHVLALTQGQSCPSVRHWTSPHTFASPNTCPLPKTTIADIYMLLRVRV